MPDGFELIEHTADTGVAAWGSDLKEAFSNAARGLFYIIVEPESVRESLCEDIEVNAPDMESLLVAWLNELIFRFDTECVLFLRCEVTELDDTHLKARCCGEKVDRRRHRLKLGVKATTYHKLLVDRQNNRVRVLFDI